MLSSFLIVAYIFVCLALTLVILLQASKGGGLAGAFGGGGGMGAVFGGRGAATFLSRLTTVLAVLFLSVALFLSLINKGGTGSRESLVEQEREKTSSLPAAGLPLVPTNENLQSFPVIPNPTIPTSPDSAP